MLILLPGPAMLFLVARGGGLRASRRHHVGAGCLVWLGIGVLRRRGGDAVTPVETPTAAPARQSDWTSWRQGYVVGIANPKVALFFPQFLDPARGSMTVQILVLGAVFVAIGTVFDTSYGALAGTISARMARRRAGRNGSGKASARGRVAIGLTYIGLGGFTAATGTRAL
jgi:threonine/homoserine/homoserine lactone efflux protein